MVAIASYYIVTSMVNRDVYTNAGLDARRARAEAKANEHHKSLDALKLFGYVFAVRPAADQPRCSSTGAPR
ncbi:hypothetical protein SCYAM73S_04564 [Streptomyces cyaneofuscatus]